MCKLDREIKFGLKVWIINNTNLTESEEIDHLQYMIGPLYAHYVRLHRVCTCFIFVDTYY